MPRKPADPAPAAARERATKAELAAMTIEERTAYVNARANQAVVAALNRGAEALRLLKAVRDADVIFAKSEWPLSQEIAAFLASGEQQDDRPRGWTP